MTNFSRSLDKPSNKNNGVGFYKGPAGPNIVVEMFDRNATLPTSPLGKINLNDD